MAGLSLAAAPGWALAHSPIPGIASFYSGVLHPFVVPAQLMALLALGLLFGQRGLARLGLAVPALIAALAIGLLVTEAAGSPDTDPILLAAGLLTALLVVLARPLPPWPLIGLALAISLLVGLGSNPDGLAGGARWGSLAGTWLGGMLCVAWIAVVAEAASRPWQKIAIRIIASWLAASALLVLALSWVGPMRHGKAAGTAARPVQTAPGLR